MSGFYFGSSSSSSPFSSPPPFCSSSSGFSFGSSSFFSSSSFTPSFSSSTTTTSFGFSSSAASSSTTTTTTPPLFSNPFAKPSAAATTTTTTTTPPLFSNPFAKPSSAAATTTTTTPSFSSATTPFSAQFEKSSAATTTTSNASSSAATTSTTSSANTSGFSFGAPTSSAASQPSFQFTINAAPASAPASVSVSVTQAAASSELNSFACNSSSASLFSTVTTTASSTGLNFANESAVASTPAVWSVAAPEFAITSTSVAPAISSGSTSATQISSSLDVASTSGTTSTVSTPIGTTSKLPSEINGKTVEEIIKEWNAELQERTGKFRKQANLLAEWDRRILQNHDVLLKLEIEVAKVVETQSNSEQLLELIETRQQEVDKALLSMEEETERIKKDERGLLLDDEAASTRDAMYEQSELIEREREQMTEQIKSIIQSLNSNQVKGGELDAHDGVSPLDAVVQILNNQMTSLMVISESAPSSAIPSPVASVADVNAIHDATPPNMASLAACIPPQIPNAPIPSASTNNISRELESLAHLKAMLFEGVKSPMQSDRPTGCSGDKSGDSQLSKLLSELRGLLETQFDALFDDLSLQNQVMTLSSDLMKLKLPENLQIQVAQVHSFIITLVKRHEAIQTAVLEHDQNQKQKDDLSHRVIAIDKELPSLDSIIVAKKEKLKAVTNRIDELKAELQALEEEQAASSQELVIAEKQKEEYSADIPLLFQKVSSIMTFLQFSQITRDSALESKKQLAATWESMKIDY